jgi:hypothetical protein
VARFHLVLVAAQRVEDRWAATWQWMGHAELGHHDRTRHTDLPTVWVTAHDTAQHDGRQLQPVATPPNRHAAREHSAGEVDLMPHRLGLIAHG